MNNSFRLISNDVVNTNQRLNAFTLNQSQELSLTNIDKMVLTEADRHFYEVYEEMKACQI